MPDDKQNNVSSSSILTQEQDAILDMYINRLDEFFEHIKKAEKIEVEIETLHLKRILTKS